MTDRRSKKNEVKVKSSESIKVKSACGMWMQRFQTVYVSINFRNCANLLANPAKMPFYAVAKGRSVGIYQSWAECEAQVKGFSGARYKKFDTESSARDFVSAAGDKSNAPKPNHTYAKNAAATSYNPKRTFSTSILSNQKSGDAGGSSQRKSQAWQELATESENDSQSDDDLDIVLNKQMDDIEKRLKTFEKGVDKIEKKVSKGSRKAVLIEPPQPKRAKKSHNEFEKDDEGFVQVYTDGACSANGRVGARAGIGIYWGDEHSLNISEPVSGRATNNCGEIQAATRAIKQAIDNGVKNLTINTDSKFLINAVTKWLPGTIPHYIFVIS